MPAWFDSLLALLAEQPATITTVPLTLGDVAGLARGPVPASAATHRYWQGSHSAPRRRLAVIGWSLVRLDRTGGSLTFARVGPS